MICRTISVFCWTSSDKYLHFMKKSPAKFDKSEGAKRLRAASGRSGIFMFYIRSMLPTRRFPETARQDFAEMRSRVSLIGGQEGIGDIPQ